MLALFASLAIMAVATAQEKAPEKPPAKPAEPAAGKAPEKFDELPPPVAAEQAFLAATARELDAFALLCFKNGFPRRARDVWLELVAEYAPDDDAARQQLGFVHQGSVWQRKPDFVYPEQDTPSVSVVKMLESRWDALAARLAPGHRDLAATLAQAGHAARAQYHFRRALRFQPADSKAQAGAAVKNVEGVIGTETELTVLQRSRMLDRAVTRLSEAAYEVKPTDRKHPVLQAAGVPCSAYATEHFVVYGDWEPEVLTAAAQWLERSLAFCGEAFAGYDKWPPKRELTPAYAFFKNRATWADVVRKNANLVGNAEFAIEYTSACSAGTGKTGLVLGGHGDAATVFDFAVRHVAQEYSLVNKDAMMEGIGHTVCGLFFGRNLCVLAAPKERKGTVAGKTEAKFELPDLEAWKDLAKEMAFDHQSAPAARLPLIKASNFSNEDRIKAWSVCDYLLRRDPRLLLELDKSGLKARNEFDVKAAFLEGSKLSLDLLEREYRRFWTEDSPVVRALRGKATPMESVSKEAPAWLDNFNRLRATFEVPAVGWSAALSTDCRMHVDYLRQNRDLRGPQKEHTEQSGKPGFTNGGRAFAERALVWTHDKDPKKAMESWLLLPGYRDALLDRSLETVGLYVDGGLLAMDVQRGRTAAATVPSAFFPYANVDGHRYKDTVPAAVDVELLGPEVKALLDKQGLGKQKQVGFPITAHFFQGDAGAVQCQVTMGGEPLPGVLVQGSGTIRRTSARGLWTFYPWQPLKKGLDVRVLWTHKNGTTEVIFMAG